MVMLAVAYGIGVPLVTKEDKENSIFISCIWNIIKLVFIQFVLFGVLMSAICKWVAESFMIKSEKKMGSSGGTGGGFATKTNTTE
jgi:hypothetical protein